MSAGLSVILPAFNEATHIGANIRRLVLCLAACGRRFEVIVVDDGSSDGTGDAARAVQDGRVRVLTHTRNRGKGRALATGCAAAEEEVVVLLDADLQIPPEDVIPLVERLERAEVDVAVGSKYHEHASLEWPPVRRLLSRLYQFVTTLLFRLPLRDTQTGLKALRRSTARELVPRLRSRRFAWDLELVLLAHRAGHPCITAPVHVRPSDRASRVGLGGALQAGLDTLRIFVRDRGLAAYGPLPAHSRAPTRVIVSGDDLGLSAGVDAGLLRGLACGGLTSVSVLTTGARFTESVEALTKRVPRADAGLHLDLLRGRAPWRFVASSARAAVEQLDRQLRALRGAGVEPTHVDAHRHAWCLPWHYPALCRAVRRADVGAARPLRPLGSVWRAGFVEGLKRLVLLACATVSAGAARRAGLASPDGWVDVREAARWAATGRVPRWARSRTVEVLGHPVLGMDVPANEQGTLDRAAETQAVLEPPLARALARVGIETITYRELAATRRA